MKTIVVNKKAKFDYELFEIYEAGICLVGTEIKSIRQGRVSLSNSYVKVINGEVFIINMYIGPYDPAHKLNHEPLRPRKLLLKKREIKRITGKIQERGLTMIPISVFLNRQWAKLEIAIARGRKQYDKREVIKKRMHEREMQRQFKTRKL